MSGVVLGFSIAAPPGPVTAMAAQQVVRRSWLSGWLVMLGATVADGAFFLLTYYGVARLVTSLEKDYLFLLGAALLAYLAVSTVTQVKRSASAPLPTARPPPSMARYPFALGLTMGLTNPFQLAWWVAVGAGMIADFGVSVAAGFFIGILAWTLIFTLTVNAGVLRYQRLAPLIAYVSAAIMVGFGAWFLVVGLLALT